MIANVATREYLLRLKRRLNLLKRCYNALDKKEKILTSRVFSIIKTVVEGRKILEKKMEEGYRYLLIGLSETGFIPTLSIVLSNIPEYRVEKYVENIAGVVIPEYRYKKLFEVRRINLVELSPGLLKAKEIFDECLEIILKFAKYEEEIIKILKELKKTRRRKKVLEKILIPKIDKEIREIEKKLDDKEREEKIRSKIIQKIVEER